MKNKSFVKCLLGFIVFSLMMVVFAFPVSANETEAVDTTVVEIQTESTEITESNDVEISEDETVIYDPEIDTAIPEGELYPDVDDGICEGQIATFDPEKSITVSEDDSVLSFTPTYDPDEYDYYDADASITKERETDVTKKTTVENTENESSVEETVSEVETESETVDDDKTPDNLGWIIGGAAIAVLGIAGVATAIVFRNKKQ